MKKTLVLGVGNTLLADEGAGVHAMRYLRNQFASLPETEFLDAGTLSFTLVDDIASTDNLIIFDAAQLDAAPAPFASSRATNSMTSSGSDGAACTRLVSPISWISRASRTACLPIAH
jgi:hydrogenase maturation protease